MDLYNLHDKVKNGYIWIERKLPDYLQSVCQKSRGRISLILVIWNFQTKPEIPMDVWFKKKSLKKRFFIFLNIDIFQIVHGVLEP